MIGEAEGRGGVIKSVPLKPWGPTRLLLGTLCTPGRGSGAEPWCFLAVPSVPRCRGGSPSPPQGRTQSHEAGAGCRVPGRLAAPAKRHARPRRGIDCRRRQRPKLAAMEQRPGPLQAPRARGNSQGELVPARGAGAGLSLVGAAGHRGRVRLAGACTRAPAGHRAKCGCVAVLGTISGASETTAECLQV